MKRKRSNGYWTPVGRLSSSCFELSLIVHEYVDVQFFFFLNFIWTLLVYQISLKLGFKLDSFI